MSEDLFESCDVDRTHEVEIIEGGVSPSTLCTLLVAAEAHVLTVYFDETVGNQSGDQRRATLWVTVVDTRHEVLHRARPLPKCR